MGVKYAKREMNLFLKELALPSKNEIQNGIFLINLLIIAGEVVAVAVETAVVAPNACHQTMYQGQVQVSVGIALGDVVAA
ncbi:hypothetical protein N7481_010941 [Penicillium waksmanii]|uniref:uncharacterized protein n=1 Tax=Penicillium waksmanii TaxID=69791 RepID=UPI002547700C|nr:uncharacterized protein N7481_010941 [Penicillium waksmanii]KAJ5973731.1 hypothetical protein N7481_010941 [Penicillium waksmanii]